MEKITVIGLGYVGLPLMVGLARHFDSVIGYDIDPKRVAALRGGHDWTHETPDAELKDTKALITDRLDNLIDSNFFIVTAPTPIDHAKRPDLKPVLGACRTVAEILKKRGAHPKNAKEEPPLIVFESTVYPGLTEEICGPEIAAISGLKQGVDFKLGYSPERINPGDAINKLETIVKVISAEDETSLNRLDHVYGKIITAGVYRATNIRVAETAKVIENTQRDINIALMNELAIICDRIGIRTHEVLQAANTKWNFLNFTPGLVGGHCIGVDPYYLTSRAEELGYHPEVILSGRRINDGMPVFVAQKVLKLLVESKRLRQGARVGMLGLSFKENVRDLRNSRIPEIVQELQSYGIEVLVYDPVVDRDHAKHEYGLDLADKSAMKDLDALVFAVSHKAFLDDIKGLWSMVAKDGCIIDIKSVVDPKTLPKGLRYWSL